MDEFTEKHNVPIIAGFDFGLQAEAILRAAGSIKDNTRVRMKHLALQSQKTTWHILWTVETFSMQTVDGAGR